MNMLLGLDYELYFGSATGSVKQCMLEPTHQLARALSDTATQYCPRMTLFVDACFLLRLQQLAPQHPELAQQKRDIEAQLKELSRKGHSIQLHIHTHWLDCDYHNGQWNMDTRRYRLHDFAPDEQCQLVLKATQLLSDISEQPVFAYRAGGWCLQPFDQIAEALHNAGIWLDSTVYPDGVCDDPLRWFDFRNAPDKPHWPFDQDPIKPDEAGRFIEIPISHQRVSPLFFWRMAALKKLGGKDVRAFGDGAAMVAHSAYYWSRLTRSSTGPASIDGIKGDLLEDAYRQHRKHNPEGYFNVMGHPKALTPRSIQRLSSFLERHPDVKLVPFEDLASLKPAILRGSDSQSHADQEQKQEKQSPLAYENGLKRAAG